MFMCAVTNGFPILFKKQDLEKRLVVTRVHTAPTNTVTDFYSTTTKIVVAPTVEFIISNGVTLTTTLIPAGVDPTAQPTTTVTTIIQNKQIIAATTTADDPSNSVVSTGRSGVNSAATVPAAAGASETNNAATTAPAATGASQTNNVATTATGASQTNAAATTDAETSADNQATAYTSQAGVPQAATSTTSSVQTGTTPVFETSPSTSTSATMVNAIGDDVVSASAVSQPPAQVHTETTVTSTSQSTSTTESSTSTTSFATASSTSTSSVGIPKALTYSPYNSDGTCRSASDVYSDLQIIKSKGVSQIRVYGTDCNSLETVQPACAKLGIKINQGFWIGSSGVSSIDSSVASLISYAQTSGWDIFEYITIGNEAIISGFCTPSELISKIQSVKSQLQAAGYTGKVTTSEPPVSFQNHPELCTSSAIDFVGINPHSYFNSQIDASQAGTFLKGQFELVEQVCGTSNIVVTETGYPYKGNANGLNVPSVENQKIAIKSIIEELNGEVTILSYFDDLWKDPGTYGIEQSFGIQGIMG